MKHCPHCGLPILREGEAYELNLMRRFHSLSASGQARLHRISVSAASNRLAKWWRAGFLKRKEVRQESGGIEYHYTHLYPERRKPKPASKGGE